LLQPEAESGINQSYDWLAEQSPTAADEWLRRIEAACGSLSKLP
jgi:plasmid stabilization system protein ParE